MRREQLLPGNQSLVMGIITAPDTVTSITSGLIKTKISYCLKYTSSILKRMCIAFGGDALVLIHRLIKTQP